MALSSTERFLDAVCAEIRWRKWRCAIRCELSAHIEDRTEDLTVLRGLSAEEGEAEAVRLMGDPAEIGRALDAQHRPWRFYLFIAATALFWGAILCAAYYLLHRLGQL